MSRLNLRFESGAAEPSNAEIGVVAYSFFEAAGRLDGHDIEHWLRAKEQLSKDLSSGIKSQKNAKAVDSRTNNGSGEKALVVRAPWGRGGAGRYAQPSTAR
jgi:hypothetical protein